MNKVMIIGGSSGIGKELALIFAKMGSHVIVTGRNEERLLQVQNMFPDKINVAILDINRSDAPFILNRLAAEFGRVDILVLCAGGGDENPKLTWSVENSTIMLNVHAFARTAQWAYVMMKHHQRGHLVAITSVAGIRGLRQAPAYSAAKSFQIRYLEALRAKAYQEKSSIKITDVRPGFMGIKEGKNRRWVSSYNKSANQIYRAILKKKTVVYVSRRWRLPAALLQILPGRILIRL
jgi:short-subunit dehydrogenase